MKIKKSLVKIIASALVFCAMTPISAMAVNHPYAFEFRDVCGTQYTDNYAKSDFDQNWYVSVVNNGRNTLSRTNILGVKAHDKEHIGYISNYQTIKDYGSYKFSYTTPVSNEHNNVFYMGAKKDSTSTSTASLRVSGNFCP